MGCERFAVGQDEPDVCAPSPCGPSSQCQNVNGQAVCSCLPQYVGTPPNCRPECVVNSECNTNLACISQKCKDPCPGVCGRNAQCRVIHHSPICSCAGGLTGDPFVYCFPAPSKISRMQMLEGGRFFYSIYSSPELFKSEKPSPRKFGLMNKVARSSLVQYLTH